MDASIEDRDPVPATASSERAGWGAATLAGLGALLLTSCCILPLALVSLGVGGVFIAQLGALYAYKWLTFTFAAGALAFGFWRAYRPVPCGEGACARPVDRRWMRGVLWVAAGVVALAMAFPLLARLLLPY